MTITPRRLLAAFAAAGAASSATIAEPIEPEIPPGYVVVDDMILPADAVAGRTIYNARLWPRHVVPYAFETNVTELNRQRTRDALNEIESVANVRFVPRTNEQAYIKVVASTVNNSYVGRQGNAQILNIVSWSWRFIIVHEFLHALGVWHEHQRSDRDEYVMIVDENVVGGAEHNFLKRNDPVFGPYDFESVMHYDAFAFSRCCCAIECATIVPLPPYEEFLDVMGQISRISDGDVAGLIHLYGPADCNGNGQHDFLDIQSGFSEDCNGNGVPDECDVVDDTPSQSDLDYGFAPYLDCDADGLLDPCEIATGEEGDCDGDGVLDACEIAAGAPDEDHNGVPDPCQSPPGGFALLSPLNGATDVPPAALLDWDDAPDAQDYLVEVDAGVLFASPLVSEVVGASELSLPPGALAHSSGYFWRVTARNVVGQTLAAPSLSAFTTAPPPRCAADIDGDGDTDVLDFALLAANFASSASGRDQGDLNDDGTVDVFDFALLAADFGCVP